MQYTDHSHDGRQDHRDVAAGLASDPQVMAQEGSFTDSGSRPTSKLLWQEMVEGASLRGP
jgi:hypothetical protein